MKDQILHLGKYTTINVFPKYNKVTKCKQETYSVNIGKINKIDPLSWSIGIRQLFNYVCDVKKRMNIGKE
jgi:hypothetical protein